LDDIKYFEKKIANTTKWLEPPQGTAYLQSYDVDCHDTVYLLSQNSERLRLRNDLKTHFEKIKTPVMVDDSVFTYCIAGVAFMKQNGGNDEFYVLRLDPHVYREDSLTLDMLTRDSPEKGVEWIKFDQQFGQKRWMVLFPGSTKSTFEKQ